MLYGEVNSSWKVLSQFSIIRLLFFLFFFRLLLSIFIQLNFSISCSAADKVTLYRSRMGLEKTYFFFISVILNTFIIHSKIFVFDCILWFSPSAFFLMMTWASNGKPKIDYRLISIVTKSNCIHDNHYNPSERKR